MSDFLRKYWFVCLLGIAFIGVLIYFIVDMNKDNVSARTADGQDVVASTDLGNVTSSDLLDRSEPYSQTILYNMYRNAVVDQTVTADSDMKSKAKTMAKNVESNMDSDASGRTRYSILSELASYGFEGDSALYDYCLTANKIQKLDADFVANNFEALKDFAPEGARTISILTMQVPNDQVLSDDSEKKQKDIQDALDSGKDFAEVAKEFSEDEATASKGGYFGYIDSSSSTLDEAVITQAVSMKAGETSDWISVQPDGMQMFTLYKVHIDETDASKIMNSEHEEDAQGLVNSMVSSVNGLEVLAVSNAAKKLDITFENDDVKAQVEDYIKNQTSLLGDLDIKEEEASSETASSESKASSESSSEKNSESSSKASSAKSSDADSASSEKQASSQAGKDEE